ncbi:hypothetical protein [Bradyrhizobium sp. Arg816]|uniref:hypothetical protein n=1 Tax=Bradyrhizobium sp. Arg816 TaxID=2998491 RepID=UPI00249F3B83|nr:hypothetical protein [Bradyrhizobium sp. Arg816]MDI3560618.1 hypothetical protein [Bradyrhizobium sp. Arg816]
MVWAAGTTTAQFERLRAVVATGIQERRLNQMVDFTASGADSRNAKQNFGVDFTGSLLLALRGALLLWGPLSVRPDRAALFTLGSVSID